MKIHFAGQLKIQNYSKIYSKNLDFKEKTLKQYILMLIQNMKVIKISTGKKDLRVMNIIIA